MQGKGVTSRGGASTTTTTTTTTTTITTTTTTKKHKFLDRVLNAIAKLAERNGSNAKAIVNYLLKTSGNTVDRNLTLQVQQALKQGVSEGLIKLRGGRYKIRCISRSGTTAGKTAQGAAPAVSCTPPQPQPLPTPQAKNSSGGGEDRRKNSTDARRRGPRQSSSKTDKHDKREKPPVASRTGKTSGSGKSNSHSESSGKSSKKSAPGK